MVLVDTSVWIGFLSGRSPLARDLDVLLGQGDVCGHELVNRADDDEATVQRRLEVYQRETKPLVLFFWERGLLRDIDAEAPEEVVADRTIEAIADLLDTYE